VVILDFFFHPFSPQILNPNEQVRRAVRHFYKDDSPEFSNTRIKQAKCCNTTVPFSIAFRRVGWHFHAHFASRKAASKSPVA